MSVGVAANHLQSSFYIQQFCSQLQIKHLFRGNDGLTMLCFKGIALHSDQISLCFLYFQKFLSCCFEFTVCMFFSPRSSCENWINNNEKPPSNFPHYVPFVLIHSMRLILVRRQLHKIKLSMRRLGGNILSVTHSSHIVFPLNETTLCLKVNCDNGFNFLRSKSKKNESVRSVVFSFRWQELAFGVIQPIENDFWYERRRFVSENVH